MNMRFGHAANFLGEGTELMKNVKKHSINWNVNEPYSHWNIRSEYDIKLIKLIWESTM